MNQMNAALHSTSAASPFALRGARRRIAGLRVWLMALVLALPPLAIAAEQRGFSTPEAAVEALLAALKANDEAALVAIFGDRHKNLVITGDAAHDAARRAESAALLTSFHALDERGDDRRVLLMGPQAWPVPIPLVRDKGAWRFATEQGVEELLNRRIGANERNAILVLNAYLDAQRQYAVRDRNGDGVLEYAQKLASTPGKTDGLYWPTDAGRDEEPSPFGPLIAESAAYLTGRSQGDPYHGYHFRILARQGASAPGGAYSYLINGRMLGGFAMVAFPDRYGESGVMSFIVSHNGKVYEKDLGRNTAAAAANLGAFNPGAGWRIVEP